MTPSRRNLKPDQASYIRGRLYNRRKKAQGAPAGNDNASKQKCQSDTVVSDTAARIALEQGVSRRTVIRDGKRAAALDWIDTNQLGRSALAPSKGADNVNHGTQTRMSPIGNRLTM